MLLFLTHLRSIEKASDNFWRSSTGTHLRPRFPTFPTRSIPRKADRSFSSRITRPIRCLQEISCKQTITYTTDSKITVNKTHITARCHYYTEESMDAFEIASIIFLTTACVPVSENGVPGFLLGGGSALIKYLLTTVPRRAMASISE